METKIVLIKREYSFILWAAGAVAAALLLAFAVKQIKTAIALYCDPNAVGTNVMVGCVWQDKNSNFIKDTGDLIIGPARQNPPYVKTSPTNMSSYQALGWWGFSYHHWGCCSAWKADPNQVVANMCFGADSCNMIGSNPLMVSGVAGWGEQDATPRAVGVWNGNFTFDTKTYFFRITGDFADHGRRLYIDGQLVAETGPSNPGNIFLEKAMTAGTHKITVHYANNNDSSLGFSMEGMVPTLAVSASAPSVAAGQTVAFKAVFDPDGTRNYNNPHYVSKPEQNVTATAEWTSSDPSIAEVTAAGQVKGLKAGTVTITAKYPLPAPSWTNNNGLETYNGIRASAQLTVTGGSTPDTAAPTVSVTAPTAGATVSGTVTLTASASDNVAVTGVQFKVDGANVGAEDATSPYSASWNTTSYSNGSHTITAVARDAAGNTKTSTAVTVTVNNAGGGGGGTTCSSTNCGACTSQTSCVAFGSACSWTGTACIVNSSNPPPAECTNRTGYASNCSSNGTKILRLTQSSINQTNIVVSVNLPASPENVIYNKGYYWSPTRRQWVSFTLTGNFRGLSTAWLENSASASLSIPRSDLATGTNYIITWDYIKNSTCWVGPEGACGTGKWRVATFNVQ